MLIPIKKTKSVFPMCDAIVEKALGNHYELDRAHTRPLGWIRFIDPDDCRNIAYFNYQKSSASDEFLFEFDTDQDDDIWLKKARTLYCICELDKRLLVVEVKNDAFSITIGMTDDEPTLIGHGVQGTMVRYFWVANTDN